MGRICPFNFPLILFRLIIILILENRLINVLQFKWFQRV